MSRPRYFRRIFALFLAAAMAPAAGVSVVYTALAGSALRREARGRLDSQAAAFASSVAAIADGCVAGLLALSDDPAVQASLSPSDGQADPATTARAFRALLRAFPRDSGPAEASVLSVGGGRALLVGGPAPDRDLGAYGSWGVFRALADDDTAVSPRVSELSDGERSSFTVGVAVRGPDGAKLGYALADVRRSAIASAAAACGLQGGASVVFPSGKLVFYQSDPGLEGGFVEDTPLRLGGEGVSTAEATGAGTEFTVLAEAPSGLYDGFGRSARNVALAGLLGAAGLAAALALRASASVTEPVLEMAQSMRLVEAGDLSIRIKPSGDDELGDLARSFNAMTAEVDALLRREVERQELLREAELRALAAQMNPHFLHNTLASIKSLAKLGRSGEISEVVSRLGKLLRSGSGRRDGLSTVRESLSSVRDYLSIEKVRFGDRFSFELDVDPALEAVTLPPLTLEPLAENALTHGLERKRGHGSLRVEGRLDGEDAVISFADDGPGTDPETMANLSAALEEARPPTGDHGMGLLGTNRRLALEYGDGYGIRIRGGGPPGSGFVATVRIPAGLSASAKEAT